jgi:Antirestriction protein (ArdA).
MSIQKSKTAKEIKEAKKLNEAVDDNLLEITIESLYDNRSKTVRLPIAEIELNSIVSNLSRNGQHDIIVSDYSSDELRLKISEYQNINQLNEFITAIADEGGNSIDFINAIGELSKTSEIIETVINGDIYELLNNYVFYPDVNSEEDLGYAIVDELGFPDNYESYFDYEGYGRDIMINEGGSLTTWGYIVQNR